MKLSRGDPSAFCPSALVGVGQGRGCCGSQCPTCLHVYLGSLYDGLDEWNRVQGLPYGMSWLQLLYFWHTFVVCLTLRSTLLSLVQRRQAILVSEKPGQ